MADLSRQWRPPLHGSRPSRKAKRPRCPQCGTRQFRRDTSTGLVVCASGHVLQGFREETADDGDDFSASQQSQRTRRRLRKEKAVNTYRGRRRRSVAAEGVVYGSRARYLYFQCLQLLLRLQIRALQREMTGIPDEFEGICRDLWAMHASLQPDLVPQSEEGDEDESLATSEIDSESISHERQRQNRAASVRSTSAADMEALVDEEQAESERRNEELRALGIDIPIDEEDPYLSDSQGVPIQYNTDDDSNGPSEVDQLTSGMEEDGSDADDTAISLPRARIRSTTANMRVQSMRRQEQRQSVRRSHNDLNSLIGILYLGLVTLRLPVQWSDIVLLIAAKRLPYLHAIYSLPEDMFAPLPMREVRRLDQPRLPTIESLQIRVLEMGRDLHASFGVQFPPLNAMPLLWRCVERLLLPPTFYVAAKRLLAYLNVPMNVVMGVASMQLEQMACGEDSTTRAKSDVSGQPYAGLDARLKVSLGRRTVAREIALMATILVLAKMRFGLDGTSRHEDPDEPETWAGVPNLKTWLAALDCNEERASLSDMNVSDPSVCADVLDMGNKQLDAYLDYAERLLIHRRAPRVYHWRRRDNVDDMLSCAPEIEARFPLGGADESKEFAQTPLSSGRRDTALYDIEGLYDDEKVDARIPQSSDILPTHLGPGEEYSTAYGAATKAVDAPQAGHRKPGRPRKRRWTSASPMELLHNDAPRDDEMSPTPAEIGRNTADTHQDDQHLQYHPTFACVLRHASRFVGCDTSILAKTVLSVESALIKTLKVRRRAREMEAARQTGKRPRGRPPKVPVTVQRGEADFPSSDSPRRENNVGAGEEELGAGSSAE